MGYSANLTDKAIRGLEIRAAQAAQSPDEYFPNYVNELFEGIADFHVTEDEVQIIEAVKDLEYNDPLINELKATLEISE